MMNFHLKKQIVTTFDRHEPGSSAGSVAGTDTASAGGGGGGDHDDDDEYEEFDNSPADMDMNSGDQYEYIFDIVSTMDGEHVVASSSDNHIHVINANTLKSVAKIKAHTSRITALQASPSNPFILYTSSEDNYFKIWDIRVNSSHQAYLNLGSSINAMSVGMNECLLATSVDNGVCFHDIRAMTSGASSKLGEYSDVHTDIVTQLAFNPSAPTVLVSAAEDGLMCVFDTSVSEGDEAVTSILNTECPIRRFGFFGESNEGIYALSTVETASFWHYPSSQRISMFPELRETFQVDYLVDCMCLNDCNDIHLVAGKFDGGISLLKVNPAGLELCCSLENGHKAMVRSSLCLSKGDTSTSFIFTGAEDSSVCAWAPGLASKSSSSGGGSKIKKERTNNSARYKPI